MGIRNWSRCKPWDPTVGRFVDPDPNNFQLLSWEEINGWTVCVVLYPNCTNFEGKKLLVYPCTPEAICSARKLDPHFSNIGLSPVARLEPTKRGLALAELICRQRKS